MTDIFKNADYAANNTIVLEMPQGTRLAIRSMDREFIATLADAARQGAVINIPACSVIIDSVETRTSGSGFLGSIDASVVPRGRAGEPR